MKKVFFVVAVLLGMLNPLHARESHNFAYSGLLVAAHVPSGPIYGAFEGEDHDGDGMLELGELSYLAWNHWTYIENGVSTCTATGYSCPVYGFYYPGAGHGVFLYVQRYTGGSLLEETIVGKHIYYPRNLGSNQYLTFYHQTRFHLDGQMVPIPEPSAAALILAGLALLGAIQLKRRCTSKIQ